MEEFWGVFPVGYFGVGFWCVWQVDVCFYFFSCGCEDGFVFLGIESFIALLFVDAFKNWVNTVPYFVKLTLGVVCVHPGHVGMCECCEGVDVFWGEVCDVVDDTGVVVAGEARSVGGELVVGELE